MCAAKAEETVVAAAVDVADYAAKVKETGVVYAVAEYAEPA